MGSSKRSQLYAALLGAGLAIAVMLVLDLGIKFQSDWSEAQQHQEAVRSDRARAAVQIAGECGASWNPTLLARCVADGVEAHLTNEQEALAQYEDAFWAKWSAIGAITAAIIGAIGVVVALSVALVTRKSVIIDQEIGHAQARAYIDISKLRFAVGYSDERSANDSPWKADLLISVVNTGNTPARNVQIVAHVWAEFPESVRQAYGVFSVSDIKSGSHEYLVQVEVLTQTESEHWSKLGRLSIDTVVIATDVFKKKFEEGASFFREGPSSNLSIPADMLRRRGHMAPERKNELIALARQADRSKRSK